MNELEIKLAEIALEMQQTKQQFRERMKQLRKAHRMATKTLEQLRAL